MDLAFFSQFIVDRFGSFLPTFIHEENVLSIIFFEVTMEKIVIDAAITNDEVVDARITVSHKNYYKTITLEWNYDEIDLQLKNMYNVTKYDKQMFILAKSKHEKYQLIMSILRNIQIAVVHQYAKRQKLSIYRDAVRFELCIKHRAFCKTRLANVGKFALETIANALMEVEDVNVVRCTYKNDIMEICVAKHEQIIITQFYSQFVAGDKIILLLRVDNWNDSDSDFMYFDLGYDTLEQHHFCSREVALELAKTLARFNEDMHPMAVRGCVKWIIEAHLRSH